MACLERTQTRPAAIWTASAPGWPAISRSGWRIPDEYRLTFLAKMMASSGPGRPASFPALPAAEHSFDILSDSIERPDANRRIRRRAIRC